jgi:tetratricopeptide (TPR) repeat protein
VTAAAVWPIAVLGVAAFAVVLWPLLRRGATEPARLARDDADRTLELDEERAAAMRALRELEFEHDAGHLAETDYLELRARYEGRAAQALLALDEIRAAEPTAVTAGASHGAPDAAVEAAAPVSRAAARPGWARHPAALVGGAVLFVAFGLVLGMGIGRYTERDQMAAAPAPPAPGIPALPPPGPAGATSGTPGQPARPLPPEMLAGMLRAARQSLADGRYEEAIAAYQAILKRDDRNVDALSHLGLIAAIAGHADPALETFDRAIRIDPAYAPAHLYRGQVLFEVKKDYPGAIAAWERYLALAPAGSDRDRLQPLLEEARKRARERPARN